MNEVQLILAGIMNNPCPPISRWVIHDCPICHNGKSGNYEIKNLKNSTIYQKIVQRQMPSSAKTFFEWSQSENVPSEFINVLDSVYNRNPYLLDLNLYWSPEKNNDLNFRYIIPYYMNNEIIGYTARDIRKYSKLKYFNQVSTNIFYNFDLLNDPYNKTILVTEGILDAALMCGVGINNYLMSDMQIQQLKNAQQKGKRIIIIPDRDKDGKRTIIQAIDNGFDVSLPDWGIKRTENGNVYIKDFEESTRKYGRLFSTLLIHKNIYSTEFEIKVMMNKWI